MQCLHGGSSRLVENVWVLLFLWLAQLRLHLCSIIQPPTFIPSDRHSFSDTSENGLRYYRYLTIGPHNESIFVGAMEYVYRLNAENINRTGALYRKSAQLQAGTTETKSCINQARSSDFQCKNHIRIILFENDRIYICGTGSYSPREFYLNKTNLLEEGRGSENSGMAKCAHDPRDEATAVYVKNGNPNGIGALYTGTVIVSYMRTDPVIYRPPLRQADGTGSDLLRTMVQNTAWLNDVHFVGSFDMGDYVFFFFREKAIKSGSCDDTMHSRVARVCKSDMGGQSTLVKRWTTFLKARLNCSIPGVQPFYFNEIRDVYKVGSNLFYGVFTTHKNGFYGSAVCAFTLEAIESVFRGRFSVNGQVVPDSSVPTPRPGLCADNSKNLPDNVLQFMKIHPLMAGAVSSRDADTVFHVGGTVLKTIVVHSNQGYTVLYLGSEKGQIYKVVQWSENGKTQSNLLAVWTPFGDREVPIWSMKIMENNIYIGTDEAVLQIDRRQCSDYTSCTYCVRDPDCGWDKPNSQCKNYTPGLIQSVKKPGKCREEGICPGAEQTVNVRARGDTIHLLCDSPCTPRSHVQWYHNTTPINSDYKKWILTKQNGLVVLEITDADAGQYECRDGSIILSKHQVNLTQCTDMDCIWKEEYREWGRAFSEYKTQYKQWTCMKDSCQDDITQCSNSVVKCGGGGGR